MISYDQARQFCKTYVAALNTSPEAYAALFAPDAEILRESRPCTLTDIAAFTPAGRSGYGGARIEGPEVVLLVKVRHPERLDLHEHRVLLDNDGRIVRLRAVAPPTP